MTLSETKLSNKAELYSAKQKVKGGEQCSFLWARHRSAYCHYQLKHEIDIRIFTLLQSLRTKFKGINIRCSRLNVKYKDFGTTFAVQLRCYFLDSTGFFPDNLCLVVETCTLDFYLQVSGETFCSV